MSTFLKSRHYVVKSNLLPECAKGLCTAVSSHKHVVIGGACCLLTELLFLTYNVECKDDEYSIYSDQYVVCKRIPDMYIDTARSVIQLRNKFTHEFGSEEYFELYNIVLGSYKDVQAMAHHVGGLPTRQERDFLSSYFGIEPESFYDESINWFMQYGPIGYRQLYEKLSKENNRTRVYQLLVEAGGN